jgi:hypothetical protein
MAGTAINANIDCRVASRIHIPTGSSRNACPSPNRWHLCRVSTGVTACRSHGQWLPTRGSSSVAALFGRFQGPHATFATYPLQPRHLLEAARGQLWKRLRTERISSGSRRNHSATPRVREETCFVETAFCVGMSSVLLVACGVWLIDELVVRARRRANAGGAF